MIEPVSKIIISQVIKEGITSVKSLLKSKNIQLVSTYENLQNALLEHNNFIINATKNISFKDLRENRSINDVYIDLKIQLQAKRVSFQHENSQKLTIENILQNERNHLIILGGPGAGKTTTIKHICQLLLNNQIEINYKFPILINLRDINDAQTIFSKLKNILGLEISLKQLDKTISTENVDLRDKYINSYLNSLNAVLILDGFDEVRPSRLPDFYQEINSLMLNQSNSRVILTSRSASYNYSIDNSTEYELCDLDQNQITEFATKWFKAKEESDSFLHNLESSKFHDFSLRPLTLAHLCAIFEKTKKFYDMDMQIKAAVLVKQHF
jgi:predicted NACHT family NTPase